MTREDIKEVMQDVFGRSFQMKDLGDWVGMACPLATWTHEKGHDSSPSAGVSVNDSDISFFNCFTCKNSGPLSKMLSQYSEFSGESLDDLIEEIEEDEFLGPRDVSSYDAIRGNALADIAMPIDESIYMDLYDSAAGHPYLRGRGISDRTARELELLYDPKDSEKEPRILFPVRGVNGELYGFSGRATRPTARLKVRDYYGLAKAQCLLGSHLHTGATRIVLAEGLMDYASLHELGECGCSVMHSTFTDAQMAIVQDIGLPTFLMYDNDKAGRDGQDLAARKLAGKVPTFRTKYPKVKIKDKSEKGWHWLADPAELMPDELQAMLDKAFIV